MLGHDSTHWSVSYEFNQVGVDVNPEKYLYSSDYTAKGDSILNGAHYSKFFIRDKYSTYSKGHNGFVGLIREDTLKKSIYFMEYSAVSLLF